MPQGCPKNEWNSIFSVNFAQTTAGMVRIRTATINDIEIIRNIAQDVWWPAYSSILSKEQIAYMLELFYTTEIIGRQIQTGQQEYLLLEADGIPVGFASYAPRDENPGVYKLHKLYCKVQVHGKGYGRQLMHAVEDSVKRKGGVRLELNVNRYNPAKMFYEKSGYTILYEEDIDIGNNYLMNDYVMGKDL